MIKTAVSVASQGHLPLSLLSERNGSVVNTEQPVNQSQFCEVLKYIIILATDSLSDAWPSCVSDARGQGPAEWQRED